MSSLPIGASRLASLEPVVLVGVGGFAGSNLRFFFDLAISTSLLATLFVNVTGCLALGFLLSDEPFTDVLPKRSRVLLGTGFISSYTTFSTFVLDLVSARPTVAVGYLAASYAFGFLAVLAGRAVAKRVVV